MAKEASEGAPKDLESVLQSLSNERREIVDRLREREWFKKTESELQIELATLPDDHDGYLVDLAQRPEEVAGVKVESLAKLARGNFALVSVFNVRRLDTDTAYTYEYISWKQGPKSGSKGLVLIEHEGKITHFILLRGDKFATARKEWDSVGGFAEPDEKGIRGLLG